MKVVLGLSIAVGTASGALAASPLYDSDGSMVLEHRLDDSYVAAHHGRLSAAIAIDSSVIKESPDYGFAYAMRASHYMIAGRFAEAEADIDHVFAMHPDAIDPQIMRVRLALMRGDGKKALDGITVAAKMPYASMWHRTTYISTQHTIAFLMADTSIAELLVHNNDAALNDLDAMMKMEEDQPWYVLNDYCYIAGIAGQLDMAELTCQESIDRNSHDTGQYDSLGFAHLRMKAWAKAIDDYNKSLNGRSDLTFSLYGRGIAKRALGDKAGGDADIMAATKYEPDIANIMNRLGAPAV